MQDFHTQVKFFPQAKEQVYRDTCFISNNDTNIWHLFFDMKEGTQLWPTMAILNELLT